MDFFFFFFIAQLKEGMEQKVGVGRRILILIAPFCFLVLKLSIFFIQETLRPGGDVE